MTLLDRYNKEPIPNHRSILVSLTELPTVVGQVVSINGVEGRALSRTDTATIRIRKGDGLGKVFKEGCEYSLPIHHLNVKVIC